MKISEEKWNEICMKYRHCSISLSNSRYNERLINGYVCLDDSVDNDDDRTELDDVSNILITSLKNYSDQTIIKKTSTDIDYGNRIVFYDIYLNDVGAEDLDKLLKYLSKL